MESRRGATGVGLLLWGTTLAIICAVGSVSAAGFAILEQSAEGTGFAYAGTTTGYGDGSSAFFNPAAMSEIQGATFSGGLHVIATQAEFQNRGSTVAGFPTQGTNGGDGGDAGLVPNLYAVIPLQDFTLGFAANVPFGLKTEYDDAFVGRYQGLKSELSVLNLSSSLAYQVQDHLSVGATIGGYRADAELTNAIDFGTLGFSQLGAAGAAALGLAPQMNDGFVRLEGDDWGLTWGLGALFTYGPNHRNRVGLHYRAKTHVTLRGDADFRVPASAEVLTARGAFSDTTIQASTTLPESLAFGTKYWVNDCWAVLYESAWTRWSRFQELRIEFDNPAQPDNVTPENWKNSWRHSIGVHYVADDDWDFRGGFTYDRTAIPDRFHRTPRIPGADRYWLSAGASYNVNEALRVNLSYAHLFVVDGNTETPGATGDIFTGVYDSSVDIVSGSLTYTLG